jgi:iron complex transport system substrate-binding protein
MEFSRFLTVGAATVTLAAALVAQPITVRDGAGQTVTLTAPARRVASLMSSTIDIIVALGAADRIAARTRYDTAAVISRAANVGGGIAPSVEILLAARPDLFIAWNGQVSSPVVNRMRALGVPVYLVDTRDTTALFATIRDIGALLGLSPRAAAAAKRALGSSADALPSPRTTAMSRWSAKARLASEISVCRMFCGLPFHAAQSFDR